MFSVLLLLSILALTMAIQPSQEQISAAATAGNVFHNRSELISFATELEGFDLDIYEGVWAFWNGTVVGAVATEQYSIAMSQALAEDKCSQRADAIAQTMDGDQTGDVTAATSNITAPETNMAEIEARDRPCGRPYCGSGSHAYCFLFHGCGACSSRDHRCF